MRFISSAAAAALSLALLVGLPAHAQQQLAEEVLVGMTELDIPTEGLVLTEDQVLRIELILNDAGLERNEKVHEIQTVIGG